MFARALTNMHSRAFKVEDSNADKSVLRHARTAIARIFAMFPRRIEMKPGRPRIEPDELPKHLRRDLGFEDGRTSPRRDIMRDY